MNRYYITLLAIFVSVVLSAQVGVNNSNPQQTLDVNGKIKVGNDGATPTAGTMRFNVLSGEFEGYDGAEWKVLSLEKSGGAPSEPEYYSGETNFIRVGESFSSLILRRARTGGSNPSSFTTVPTGRYFIVTHVNILDNNGTSSLERMDVDMSAITGSNGSPRQGTRLRYAMSNHDTRPIIGSLSSPVMILRGGEQMRFSNRSLSSQTTVNVVVRGFLVDDLDY
ncbi:hypothetical protein [Lewinella sp. 4G2]|uniref:hypothetical protein n=1 Tax=Lewinella sp. 4G2 TaxID=1803372 RepID=UPI0007B4C56F|nr:hypothetical protein [Lewinella sp. 4G2]OAV46164.1 hypothetical protein A3850_018055 [Lewinella sp. 4G2]